jgi:hypothetical protein
VKRRIHRGGYQALVAAGAMLSVLPYPCFARYAGQGGPHSYKAAMVFVRAYSGVISATGKSRDFRLQGDQYPIRSSDDLSPPSVQKPIYRCARAVAVYGFKPGATVDVYANVTEHLGQIGAPETWVTTPQQVMLIRPVNVNDIISATQTDSGFTSKHSFYPVTVGEDPAITTPVVDADLWECGRVVNVHNLRASTHVEVRDLDASPPGSIIGTGESTSGDLPVITSKLVQNHRIVAFQIFCLGMPDETKSPQSGWQRVPAAPNPPPAPSIDPPIPGGHTVTIRNLLVGAFVEAKLGSLVINNSLPMFAEWHDTTWLAVPPFPSNIPLGQPTATQTLCAPSPIASAPPAATSLPPLVLRGPICDGSHFVTVWNALPGATLILVRGGVGIGYGSGSSIAVGGGITLSAGDDLTVVQQEGSLTSPPSNHVIVGCDSRGNVVTHHNDNGRTGVNPHETILTPKQILAHGMAFKQRFLVSIAKSPPLVRAQTLYVRNVPFEKEPRPANGLFVCDTDNGIFAYNVDTGALEWAHTLFDIDPRARPNTGGIRATPVIDSVSGRMYVCFRTLSAHGGSDAAFWVAKINCATGKVEKQVLVAANTYRNDGKPLPFDARIQKQHAALLLDHGSVYVAFCSGVGEDKEYHGWVIAFRASDLGQVGSWCASPNYTGTSSFNYATQDGSGIWEGGGGLSADADGNVYFCTGNGEADVANDSFGDCLIKLTATPAGLVPSSYVPADAKRMKLGDGDLGSGGTLVFPGTNFVIGGGKPGYMFLLNGTNMTLQQPRITATTSQYTDDNAEAWRYQSWYTGPHLHGNPTFWRGADSRFGYFYVWGEKDFLRQYRYDTVTNQIIEPAIHTSSPIKASDSPPDGDLPSTGPSSGPPAAKYLVMPGGLASLSSNGNSSGSGVLWSTLPEGPGKASGTSELVGHLFAFDAETLKPLWDTQVPSLGHWAVPTIADGKVFVGTGSGYVLEYELGSGHNSRRPWVLPPPPTMHKNAAMTSGMEAASDEAMMFLPAARFSQIQPPGLVVQKGVIEGDGTIQFPPAHNPTVPNGLQVRGSYTPFMALVPAPGVFGLKLNAGIWTASDRSAVSTRLVNSVAAPDDGDAMWVLYKVTKPATTGLLAGVTYILQAFTRGGVPLPMAVKPEPYHTQLILYRAK